MIVEPSWTVASTDGVDVAVYDYGGAGDTLLIAHATGMCAGVYRRMAAELATDFHVLALDLRGHGRSTRPSNDDFDWDRVANDTLAVCGHLGELFGVGPIHGFGHSMGAATMLLAETFQPGTFASMWLYEPIVFPDGLLPPHREVLAKGARLRRADFPSRADAMSRFAGRPPFAEVQAGVLADYLDNGFADTPDGGVTLRCRPHDESAVYLADDRSRVSRLVGITAPITIAAGGADMSLDGPGDLAAAVAEAISTAELVMYPRLNHFGPLQDPIGIAHGVQDFIRSVS